MDLPKYVRIKGKQLYYQRDYPTNIRDLIGKKTYSANLRINNTESATAIQKAAIEHSERFELDCKTAKNSDISAYTDAELDKQALRIIEKARLNTGELNQVNEAFTGLDPTSAANIALGEANIDALVDKQNAGEPITFHDKALLRARNLLTTKKSKQLKTLSQLWQDYVKHRGIDLESRNGKKAKKYWEQWFSLIGEQYATKDLNEAIADSLQDFADSREGKVSQRTIERELSDVMAALKLGSKRYRLIWNIQRPVIKKTSKAKKFPLTKEEQHKLVTTIFNKPLTTSERRASVLGLLYLQGGMMASEVQRLLPQDISLNTAIPHIVIRNKAKTDARHRIVPIVLGIEFLKAHMTDTIEWTQNITESTWSALLKKFLRKATGNPVVTGHCLRHTFKANAQAVGASPLSIASIAGWTEGQRTMSEHLLNYGSQGISSSAIVLQLYNDNKQINQHLIDIEKQSTNTGKVVALRR